MKKLPTFSNMSMRIGDLEIDDVFTKVGQTIDILTGKEDGLGEEIGSILDVWTEDVHIDLPK